jgi:hypothetical protein
VRSVSEDATVEFLGVLWSDDTPDDGQDEDEEQRSPDEAMTSSAKAAASALEVQQDQSGDVTSIEKEEPPIGLPLRTASIDAYRSNQASS